MSRDANKTRDSFSSLVPSRAHVRQAKSAPRMSALHVFSCSGFQNSLDLY